MAIPRQSLESIPFSFATVSCGTPDDPLPDKLEAISKAGFKGIELGFPDLLSYASMVHNKEIEEDDYNNLCTAAGAVKVLCEKHGLQIMMLQPFSNFEGWPEGSEERKDAFDRARGWIEVMKALGTDMLQVGSSDSPNITSDINKLASDLRELADMLAAHNFRLAYENWCWATHAPTWKSVWNIVKAVNRPNVGLCLDTFQTAGSEWADPTTKSGMIESTDFSQTYIEERFQQSMKELAETVPAEKIYLLQISDGYKPAKPIENKVDDSGLRPRGQWSHDFRPYPFNGGYLPVVDVTRAVLKTGARCWFSMEVFDGGRHGQGGMKYDFEEFTQGAMDSMRKLLDECAKVEAPSGVQTPVAQ